MTAALHCMHACIPVALVAMSEQAPIHRETQLGGVVAAVRAEDVDREVGAPIPCSIRFTGPDAASISVVPVDQLGEFDVLSISPPRLADDADGRSLTIDLVLSTLASGAVTPEPLEVRWIHGGAEMDGKVEFPEFSVKSLLGEKVDPAQFRDIAGLIEIRSPLDWLPWVAGGAAVAAAAATAWWMLRRRAGAPLTADEWALGELTRLERAGLPERGAYGLYFDDLTSVVRRYVSLRYAIRAEQQTTREFIDAARTRGDFPQDETERLKTLLRLADLVKFAQAEPTRGECDAHLSEARAFVERTRAPREGEVPR